MYRGTADAERDSKIYRCPSWGRGMTVGAVVYNELCPTILTGKEKGRQLEDILFPGSFTSSSRIRSDLLSVIAVESTTSRLYEESRR
jgi:hypothetical protein